MPAGADPEGLEDVEVKPVDFSEFGLKPPEKTTVHRTTRLRELCRHSVENKSRNARFKVQSSIKFDHSIKLFNNGINI